VVLNQDGLAHTISRNAPIGIGIRDYSSTESIIYSTLSNNDGTYNLIVEQADTSVKLWNERTLNVGENCGSSILANEKVIILSCKEVPGGMISVYRESDLFLFVKMNR
jgi:WD40 repeat protein